MTKLIFLGTSNAIPDAVHENTHMVLEGEKRTILIDCVNNQLLRLHEAGVNYNKLTDIILTHFHPDHVSGVPQLLMNLWLLGSQQTLNIYGLHHTLDRVEEMMNLYGWKDWPNFLPVVFHRLPDIEMVQVLQNEETTIYSSPVKHMIPTLGLRIELLRKKKILVYSCDTEPCAQVVRLARRADILIHESSGLFLGHSSAAQAGEIASMADVGRLYLIHYPTGKYFDANLAEQAKQHFSGPVVLAEDLMELDFN